MCEISVGFSLCIAQDRSECYEIRCESGVPPYLQGNTLEFVNLIYNIYVWNPAFLVLVCQGTCGSDFIICRGFNCLV
jgi:hypothetical protein